MEIYESVPFVGPGGGAFRLAYVEHGDRELPTLVCAHGLTRNASDFDVLARRLDESYRVVCLDFPGRGRSDWLPDPSDYGYPTYLMAVDALLQRLGADRIDWLGTSMGGLVGLLLAARPDSPVQRLILNDVGPMIPKAALERIASYVGGDPRFAGLEEAEAYLRTIHAPFGNLSDDAWRSMARNSTCPKEDGTLALHYDPAIGRAFGGGPFEDALLWSVWDAVHCPVLLLRGAKSDILLPETVQEMVRRGPPVDVVEFEHVGHAPALLDDEQIGVVRDWLASRSPYPGGADTTTAHVVAE